MICHGGPTASQRWRARREHSRLPPMSEIQPPFRPTHWNAVRSYVQSQSLVSSVAPLWACNSLLLTEYAVSKWNSLGDWNSSHPKRFKIPPRNEIGMEYFTRFMIGGLIVSSFTMLGDVLRPKSFAGLFSAAP